MATNGVDKPVLNVFRMFGMMQGDRVAINQDLLSYDYTDIRDNSVRGDQPDVNAQASIHTNSAAVMVWNYHDNNNLEVPDAPVNISLQGLPADKVLLTHFRIDQEHSNSYTLWKQMGSPQNPTQQQIKQLEEAGQLELFTSPQWIKTEGGKLNLKMDLPRQGISLLKLDWEG